MAQRKFECWQCYHRFMADDEKKVECPHCHSDNVDYAHFHLQKGMWKWIVGVLVCVTVVWGFLSLDWKCSGNQTDLPDEPIIPGSSGENTDTIEKQDTAIVNELGISVPPTINIKGKPVYKEGYYSCDVIVKNPPKAGTFYIVVLDHFDISRVLARSDDGHFDKLPPSNADGQYDFAVCAKFNDSLLCEPIPRNGFLPQKSVATKMAKEQLQKLIDSEDDSLYGEGGNDFIAPDCKLIFSGLPAGALDVPTTLAEVAEKVGMRLWNINITGLEYDNMNRITVVKIAVKSEN